MLFTMYSPKLFLDNITVCCLTCVPCRAYKCGIAAVAVLAAVGLHARDWGIRRAVILSDTGCDGQQDLQEADRRNRLGYRKDRR